MTLGGGDLGHLRLDRPTHGKEQHFPLGRHSPRDVRAFSFVTRDKTSGSTGTGVSAGARRPTRG